MAKSMVTAIFRNNDFLIAPNLFYSINEDVISASEVLSKTALPANFNFDLRYPNSILEIILVEYSLNGTYLGIVPLSESHLTICSTEKDKFHFGTFYRMNCHIQLQHLLHLSGGQPVFSDLYIAFRNKSGRKQMHAIPIINENIRFHGEFVNRLTPNEFYNSKWILTRRLYFIDSIALDATSQNTAIIRLPEKIEIKIQTHVRKLSFSDF